MRVKKEIDTIIETLKSGGKVPESQVKVICEMAINILKEEENTVYVDAPVTICGDIHGQFDDLLELFKVSGYPPYTSYVFLGDYVDRGRDSVETFLLLLSFKVRYKKRITLLRGNHQSKLITQVYGFYDQCIRKYGSLNVWKYITEVFNYLTLTAVVNQRVLCVHGGLSPKMNQLSNLKSIDRIMEIPPAGLMSDLLWSDPEQIQGWKQSGRGAGFLFGKDVTQRFCFKNSLDYIARAHQLVMEGYKFVFPDRLVTVWSAPNYFYRCGNVASVLELDEHMQKFFKIFEEAPIQTTKTGSQEAEVPHYFL